MNDPESLKKIALKERDSTAAMLFMRPVSIRITGFLLKTEVSPTQVTLLHFLLRVFASCLFVFNIPFFTLVAGFSLYFSHVLDCVDGELARAKDLVSSSGALLDYFLDRGSDIVVYSSITLALILADDHSRILVLAIGGFALASDFFMTDIGQMVNQLKEESNIQSDRGIVPYFRYGGSANTMILLLGSILNRLLEALILIGILSSTFTILRFGETLLSLTKKHRSPGLCV